ncbi:MAG TPA: biotin transporter BioY [Alphaproteobacteria bacterium]|nr:biotin transporter BioY [Alphaproteobacteria bacterium]
MTTQTMSLAAAAWPAEGRQAWLRNVVLVLAGSALLAVSARIQVPMWPVPVSLQTFAVLVIGMSYGGRLAAATLAAYLAQGAIGLPVFTAPLGGPTTGYLFGFLIAATVIGFLADRGWDRNVVTAGAALLIGNALIYLPGLAWLHAVYVHDLQGTLLAGFYPFLVGDALKLALAAAALPFAWKLMGRRRA